MIDILSFGGGVGSWGYAALVVQGKIPAPYLAAIVDTGRECPSTWDYINRHRDKLPFELLIITQPLPSLWSGNGNTFLPGGYDLNRGAFLRGFCSSKWKSNVMRRELKRIRQITKYNLAFGIHADEWQRVRKSSLKSMPFIYPLVDLNITRADCAKAALEVFGETPPRSRCWMCPAQRKDEWNDVATFWPELYQQALQIDSEIRQRVNLTLFGSGTIDLPCGGQCFV